MNEYRKLPNEFDLAAAEPAPGGDPIPAIGNDERRMHVRAYNYWVSLLDGRDYPSIEDLEPGNVQDFAANSVLLDFTSGGDDPATPYIGSAVREECGLDGDIRTIADVPSRSLLSRLTDHYMQIIANRAPVGFEAEFDNQRGDPICYRGILMPFSSDGDTIDFIYGVINWKRSETSVSRQTITPALPPADIAEDDEPLELTDSLAAAVPEPLDERFGEPSGMEGLSSFDDLEPMTGLADQLSAARETAEAVKSADHRSRAALYRALGRAYDFALAADEDPQGYAELLEDSGLKAQARAPMTPVVKLVFGIDYDKTRLTEFAAALSYAQRKNVAQGEFLGFIDGHPGGLKALVGAEREERRPEPRTDKRSEAAKAKLRTAAPLELAEIVSDEEFTIIVARRIVGGGVEAVAVVSDEALIERVIRRAGA